MRRLSADETRLNRDAWLHRSLEVLRMEGIHGIRIERLARDLDVTKGSFYWHFEDREELRKSLLDYWEERFTDVVIQNRDLPKVEPAKGLLSLIIQVVEGGLDQFEIAMRAWGDHDPLAGKRVRAVYEKRTKFVMGFFERRGFRGEDAEARTRLILSYLCWAPGMYPDEPKAKQIEILTRQINLLMRP